MSAAPPASLRPSVLVVDDDQDTLDSLHEALGDEFDVVTTGNCRYARELARRSWIDVVLVDVALPGDGLEVVRGIRDCDGAPEVIVLSGVDDTRVVVAAVQYGAADYVVKPFEVAELRRRIVRACERRRHRVSAAPVDSSPGSSTTGAFLLAGADVGSLAAVSIALGGRVDIRLASSPRAALALFAELTPALVLLDTALPSAEWWSVLRTIGASARRCPIIVSTPTPAARDIGPLPAGLDVTVIRARDLGELLERLGEATGRTRLPRYRPPVLRAIECMAGRYASPLRTDDVARAAGLSVRHCAHLFRADTGSSVMAYLARLRAEIAKCLLVADGVTLSQVAREAGFSDASHMSRVFLRAVGQRPGRFRRCR